MLEDFKRISIILYEPPNSERGKAGVLVGISMMRMNPGFELWF